MSRIVEFKTEGMTEEQVEDLAMNEREDGEVIAWEATEYLDELRNLNGKDNYYTLIHYRKA